MITWDIETEPLPDEQLEAMIPEFDPKSVKLGNLKDEAKIAAKIESAEESHRSNFFEKAALSATTGRVLAIGYYRPSTGKLAIDGAENESDEPGIIERFWRKAEQCRNEKIPLVGLNIHDFDLPFLMRRSWILEIDIPDWVISQDRFFDSVFVDLRKRWLCGQRMDSVKSSFDEFGRAFGSDGKTEGVDGGDFARLWKEDRDKAIEYLTNDVQQPAIWAQQMGVY